MVTLAFEGGGPERDTILLSNALAAKGHSVGIVALRDDGYTDGLIDPAVRVVNIPQARIRFSIPALRRAIRSLSPRYVVGSGIPSLNLATLVAVRSLRKHIVPSVILREVAVPSMAHLDPSRSNRIAYRALRHLYRHADHIITPTLGAQNDLTREFGVPEAKMSVMGTNAVVSRSMAADMANDTNPDQGREDGLIVSVARLSAEKGHHLLLQAMTLLPPDLNWRLAIIGEGPERPALEGFVRRHGFSQRVIFTGQIADPLVWVRRAQVAVCSSVYEGFGNAIVEALACGTPVVSTDCPYGPREILQAGRYGTLTPVRDPMALARAIEATLASTPDRARLMQHASVFTAERAADRLVEIAASLQKQPAAATAASLSGLAKSPISGAQRDYAQ